jgi:hypothetical protein
LSAQLSRFDFVSKKGKLVGDIATLWMVKGYHITPAFILVISEVFGMIPKNCRRDSLKDFLVLFLQKFRIRRECDCADTVAKL